MKTKTKPVLLRNLNRTYSARPRDIEPRWYLVDASGQTVGRMAARISKVLLGKHTPLYTAHIDTGDFVVVINSEKVVLTGKKWSQKMYHHHSGYTGGLKSFTAREKLKKDPTFPVRNAISGMLPKSILGRKMLKKLKVYAGPNHPHSAQKPVPLVLR
ncbi:50S ribosomal protein L13 [bacterium]|nr:50S ribosomal protein L13 [bacterium]